MVVVAALSEQRRAGAAQIWWTPDGVQATGGADYLGRCGYAWFSGVGAANNLHKIHSDSWGGLRVTLRFR